VLETKYGGISIIKYMTTIEIQIKLQSLTGKYRGLQGNPCNENRDPAIRTGVPCNENRFFPVGIGSQGVPFELYRVWFAVWKRNGFRNCQANKESNFNWLMFNSE